MFFVFLQQYESAMCLLFIYKVLKNMQVNFLDSFLRYCPKRALTLPPTTGGAGTKGNTHLGTQTFNNFRHVGLQTRTLRRAGKIVADPSHPGQKLFEGPSLRQEAAVHQDQNLTPQNQLLPGCRWPY